MKERYPAHATVEEVIAADPTRVWSLLGDPSRLGEWAGVSVVGYMGTELPRPGQHVFIRRGRLRSKPHRVEIEAWDAGERIVCIVHAEPEPIRFEMTIHPEVEPGAIATRVRLKQRVQVPAITVGLTVWWVERQLAKKMRRIAKASRS